MARTLLCPASLKILRLGPRWLQLRRGRVRVTVFQTPATTTFIIIFPSIANEQLDTLGGPELCCGISTVILSDAGWAMERHRNPTSSSHLRNGPPILVRSVDFDFIDHLPDFLPSRRIQEQIRRERSMMVEVGKPSLKLCGTTRDAPFFTRKFRGAAVAKNPVPWGI